MEPKSFVVAGGGAREQCLAQLLHQRHYPVWTWGWSLPQIPGWRLTDPFPAGLWMIGPMEGVDADGRFPSEDHSLVVDDALLERLARAGGGLAAGRLAPEMKQKADAAGVPTVAYREREEFVWLNAVPTAEGAIRALIDLDGYGLDGRRVSVLGFGHVGSVLALKLQAAGGRVWVMDGFRARRAQASAYGLEVRDLRPDSLDGVDLAINTIPVPVVTSAWLPHLTGKPWLELASPPGGLEPELRRRLEVVDLPGLPGKVLPRRAAEIILQSVLSGAEELRD